MEDMTARAQSLAELASKLKEMSSRFKVEAETLMEERATKPAPGPVAPKVASKATGPNSASRMKESLTRRGVDVDA
jgi:hypothetical protein